MIENKIISLLEKENKELKKQLSKLVDQNHLKDEIVIQQSKMASMGEMINNIAHQWRQPLMEISSLLMNADAKIKLQGSISNNDISSMIDKSNHVVKFMSDTIEDFRNFFATDKLKEHFIVAESVSSVLNIMNTSLSSNNIQIQIIIKNNITIHGLKNEYAQVLINIISNAKDAIVANGIKDGQIIIKLYSLNDKSIVEIEDNAGGIPIPLQEKVFEPFFTYEKKDGTGVGLFMSKLIIENSMNGVLTVENKNKGACFKIIL